MDLRDRSYIKEAKERAKAYAAIKRGYTTPEEKKACRIAERLRHAAWMDGLAALDADERLARLRAFRAFRTKVFFATLFAGKRTADAHAAPEGGHIYTDR